MAATKRKRSVSPLALGMLIAAPFFVALAEPLFDRPATQVGIAMVLLAIAMLIRPAAFWQRLDRGLRARPLVANLLLAAVAVIVTLGGLEALAFAAVETGSAQVYRPMRTLVPAGTEDWRFAHITADRFREPDPVLLWRSVDRAPYNGQRMKGPLAEIPKRPEVLRVMTYGDSNTDGPNAGGWPELLAPALEARLGGAPRVEVLNAGVAGYSSHQGLLRFRQEVTRFTPDLVLVSFGWNDLANPIGPPDRAFQPPAAWRIGLERMLLEYRAFLVARRWLIDRRGKPTSPPSGQRVPLDDYRANLQAFVSLAREHGAVPVLMTRPYRLPTATIRKARNNWRHRLPEYNRALLDLAQRLDTLAIDVQGTFEAAEAYFVDECHFNPAGQARMAELLAERLADVVAPPRGSAS